MDSLWDVNGDMLRARPSGLAERSPDACWSSGTWAAEKEIYALFLIQYLIWSLLYMYIYL